MIGKQARKVGLKFLSLLLDRRLLLYLLSVAFVLLAYPQAEVWLKVFSVIGGSWLLIVSWTARPPSGLDFDKIVYDKTGELARLLRQLGIDEG